MVDYLQIFPLPEGGAGQTEGADHWRVGAIKNYAIRATRRCW
ncbi:hypothetical protein DFAR_3760003 [Desulfarculales bacterium]